MRRFGNLSVVVLMIALACASSGYPAASARYDAESRAYQGAYDKLVHAKATGALTHAQDAEASHIVGEVKGADALTFADLSAWKSSGKEPADYAAHAQTLRDAQAKLIQLAAEVH